MFDTKKNKQRATAIDAVLSDMLGFRRLSWVCDSSETVVGVLDKEMNALHKICQCASHEIPMNFVDTQVHKPISPSSIAESCI